jgi:hypothetical protein
MDKKQELAQQLLESADCLGNLEDQVIKLFCLLNCCIAHHKQDGEEFISRRYIKEKVGRVCSNVPLILDASAKAMYVSIMLGALKNANLQKDEQGTPHP